MNSPYSHKRDGEFIKRGAKPRLSLLLSKINAMLEHEEIIVEAENEAHQRSTYIKLKSNIYKWKSSNKLTKHVEIHLRKDGNISLRYHNFSNPPVEGSR